LRRSEGFETNRSNQTLTERLAASVLCRGTSGDRKKDIMRDFSAEKYEEWRRRLGFILARYGRSQEADDAVNEFCQGMLEGKHQHQTLDQFVVDYLRKSSGDKRSRSYSERQNLINADSFEPDRHEREHRDDSCGDMDTRIDFRRMLGAIRVPVYRYIFSSFYAGGLTMKEIAEDLGVTESRVSQLLSKAEYEVAKYISQGLANCEIADRLFVTEKTVKYHATNIYAKLQVKGRSQLIVMYKDMISREEIENKIATFEKSYEPKIDESNTFEELPMSNWEPMTPKPLANAPLAINQQKVAVVNQQDNVTFIVNTFKVNETIHDLQTMSKEVTKGDYSVEKVMAACQCIGRMNETIQTVMKAAQVINGR
jgi:RNA polymerase sigma factor (sigma-70 family)